MDYENAIEIKGLTKKYDGFTLDHISFQVPKGSIMGFIGQNGAGKTTTINSILNIIKKDEGEIKIFGLDHEKHETEIKNQMAAVFDELPFAEDLNAKQLSRILKGVFQTWDDEQFQRYLDRFQLPSKKKFSQFSKGMKMKLQIASALSHGAKLLVMDEATTGLDPVVRNEFLDLFLEFVQEENHSILMSSHITSDLEKVADYVTFIDRGKILITGMKDEILDNHGVIKCSKADFAQIDPKDYIAARVTDFGAEVMVADRHAASRTYGGLVLDKTTLEEIMLFYVTAGRTPANSKTFTAPTAPAGSEA
ncbi:MAG: ABC transporter ATP-binding protein [Lachnospiraceae bacterium]|nr:ABC transporter ATP-binding protein [Lachnospiraceae bacterium]